MTAASHQLLHLQLEVMSNFTHYSDNSRLVGRTETVPWLVLSMRILEPYFADIHTISLIIKTLMDSNCAAHG